MITNLQSGVGEREGGTLADTTLWIVDSSWQRYPLIEISGLCVVLVATLIAHVRPCTNHINASTHCFIQSTISLGTNFCRALNDGMSVFSAT